MTIVDCVHDYFLHFSFFLLLLSYVPFVVFGCDFLFIFFRLNEIMSTIKKRALEEKRLKQDQPMDEMPMIQTHYAEINYTRDNNNEK